MRTLLLAVTTTAALICAQPLSRNQPADLASALIVPIQFDFETEAQQTQRVPPSGQSGYYQPVQPRQPYQRKCGTVATDVCAVDVTVPAGATAAQVYDMAAAAERQGRKAEAKSYLEKSAEMGYAKAQAAVGKNYAHGNGGPRDPAKAAYWLGKAAAQGERGAQFTLGEMYEKGEGVPQNQAYALRYYEASAAQHDGNAEFALGVDYEFGHGVAHNRATAIRYLRASSADGDPTGTDLANALARAPASRQFRDFDDLSAYLHPQVRLKPGACGPVPTLSTVINRYGFDQMHIWCNSHHGCPYEPEYGGPVQYCY